MSFFCKSIILCVIVFSVNQSNAQNESVRFDHVGIEEGLSNEKITTILQDSKGFLWFGTFDGLYKYDAYSFTKYEFNPFDSTSLSHNFIYTIFEDKYGTIWVSTFEGLCKFDRSTEKFVRHKPSPDAIFSNPNISSISEDNDGMLWVASFSGLCRFDREKGIFLPDKFELPGINCIHKDRTGTLWLGSVKGLYRLNLIAKKSDKLSKVNFTHYQADPVNPDSLSSNNIRSVFEDRHSIIWIATDNGLNSFDRKKGIFQRYQHDVRNSHSISSNNLAIWLGKSIQEDPEGNLWIGTDNGLNKLNAERSAFTSYLHDPRNAYSLSTNIVASLHVDKAGILYAGSWGGKLNIANLNAKGFVLRRADPNNPNSLSSNAVTSICEDSSGIFWIGTFDSGLNRWNKNTDQFTHLRHKADNSKTLKSDSITAVLEDHHGHLWVCNGNVLSQLNKQTSEFTHYRVPGASVIFSITEDQQGLLWLGTAGGIRSFDEKTSKFSNDYRYNPKNPDGISDGAAQTIFADSKGNIWIGYGSMGTDKYDKKTKRFSHYKHNPRDSTSISSNIVFSFYEDSKGNLWLGSWAGGLSYFDYKKESFKTFPDKHGLAGTTVFSIAEDNNGHLWLGTRTGLSRFDPATKAFTNYDYKDGLQDNVFAAGIRERGAHFKGRDGTLYFGGINGFNFFNPLELKVNSYKAPIVITQFKIFDKMVKGANESKEIVLKHNQNYFSFEFSSLSFYNPAKNQYAYKLEGVDKNWVFSVSRRYVAYTNIDPGKYTFRVRGTNNDGVWNESGAYITIIINPPWWRTWWSYITYVLLFAAGVWLFTWYRSRSLRAENLRLEQKVIERTTELERSIEEKYELNKKIESQQALLNERLRISRELHDDIGSTLGSISIYSEVAKKRTEKKENTNEVLAKIGLASRELIDKMSDIVWSLNPNNESFEQLQNRMMAFAAMMLAPRNILYDFIAAEELKTMRLTNEQRKNIFLIFKEALYNIVKYAGCKNVHIILTPQKNGLAMTIRDDGKGFNISDIAANGVPHEGNYIGGNGIKNMKARAADMHATLCIDSKIDEGTTVQLTVNA